MLVCSCVGNLHGMCKNCPRFIQDKQMNKQYYPFTTEEQVYIYETKNSLDNPKIIYKTTSGTSV